MLKRTILIAILVLAISPLTAQAGLITLDLLFSSTENSSVINNNGSEVTSESTILPSGTITFSDEVATNTWIDITDVTDFSMAITVAWDYSFGDEDWTVKSMTINADSSNLNQDTQIYLIEEEDNSYTVLWRVLNGDLDILSYSYEVTDGAIGYSYTEEKTFTMDITNSWTLDLSYYYKQSYATSSTIYAADLDQVGTWKTVSSASAVPLPSSALILLTALLPMACLRRYRG